MTFRAWSEKYLINNGLWPDEAKAVVEAAEASSASEPMKGRWDDDESRYPPIMKNVIAVTLRREAVKWIDANKPMHFAREMFVEIGKR